MPRTNKNCESVILETKFHNSQINNDAAKLEHAGKSGHDTSNDYAMASHVNGKHRIFFASQNRYERWLKQQTSLMEWNTTIINNQKQVI